MDVEKEISRMFREDYYLRNRVSTKDFYEFKDRVLAVVGEYQKQLQKHYALFKVDIHKIDGYSRLNPRISKSDLKKWLNDLFEDLEGLRRHLK